VLVLPYQVDRRDEVHMVTRIARCDVYHDALWNDSQACAQVHVLAGSWVTGSSPLRSRRCNPVRATN
jgi:hypothetical protein